MLLLIFSIRFSWTFIKNTFWCKFRHSKIRLLTTPYFLFLIIIDFTKSRWCKCIQLSLLYLLIFLFKIIESILFGLILLFKIIKPILFLLALLIKFIETSREFLKSKIILEAFNFWIFKGYIKLKSSLIQKLIGFILTALLLLLLKFLLRIMFFFFFFIFLIILLYFKWIINW